MMHRSNWTDFEPRRATRVGNVLQFLGVVKIHFVLSEGDYVETKSFYKDVLKVFKQFKELIFFENPVQKGKLVTVRSLRQLTRKYGHVMQQFRVKTAFFFNHLSKKCNWSKLKSL